MSIQQFWWKKKTAARHIQFTMADSEKIGTSVRMMKMKVTKNNKMSEKKYNMELNRMWQLAGR